MNIAAAQQAAQSLDIVIRTGGVQAALANLDLLNAIAQAAAEAKAAQDAAEAKPAEPEKKDA